MLILAVPHIFAFLGEPKVDERLVVNINIDLIAVGEAVVSVVLVAPPVGCESQKNRAHELVEVVANLSAAMSIVVSEPSCLLEAHSDKD